MSGSIKRIVGITGGIGSGKSVAAKFLQKELGSEFIDADLICRNLLEKGNPGWQELVNTFGDKYLNKDQTLNRPALREDIFRDIEIRFLINNLLHPLVGETIARIIGGFEKKTQEKTSYVAEKKTGNISNPCCPRLFLVEVPLLYEAVWEKRFDRTIVIYANRWQCLDRLMRRDGISAQEAELAIKAQFPLAEKALLADHVVDNSGPWPDTCLQLLHLGSILRGK